MSYAVLNIAAPCNNNTKLPSNKMCARIRFWSGKKKCTYITLDFILYDS